MAAPAPGAPQILRAWAARPGRAVIFDFNGTLSDDEPILEEIFTDLFAAHLGWQMSAADYRSTLRGRSDREIVEIAVRDHGGVRPELTEDLLRRRGERYKQIVAEKSPVAGPAAELVERLAVAQVPMAVVTGAQRADVQAVLDSCGVGRRIELLVTDEDVRTGKPDPEGFLLGARLLGVPPEDVLVFEDSVPGIRGALAAGMACIAVTGSDPDPAVVAVAPGLVGALSADLVAGYL